MNLTDKDKKLLLILLDYLNEVFSNAGCNDVPDEWVEHYNDKELREMLKIVLMCDDRGADIDDFEEDDNIRCLGDSGLIYYLKQKLK